MKLKDQKNYYRRLSYYLASSLALRRLKPALESSSNFELWTQWARTRLELKDL